MSVLVGVDVAAGEPCGQHLVSLPVRAAPVRLHRQHCSPDSDYDEEQQEDEHDDPPPSHVVIVRRPVCHCPRNPTTANGHVAWCSSQAATGPRCGSTASWSRREPITNRPAPSDALSRSRNGLSVDTSPLIERSGYSSFARVSTLSSSARAASCSTSAPNAIA